MIFAIILGAIAAACFVISIRQFKQKGFLFNNAYIYASKADREKMDKAPHYRQSGVVFALIGVIFALDAAQVIFKKAWLFYVVIAVVLIALLYAVVSAVKIEKEKKQK